jgi:outer membrane biosynthesis protein TonB
MHGWNRVQQKGDKMFKSFRAIAAATMFLSLAWTLPASARQEKKEERPEPARQEQQREPEKQQQTRAPQQQPQAKPPVQQAKAPRPEQQAKPEKQQQVKAPQQAEQKPQQEQSKPASQPQRQAAVRQQQSHRTQVASSQRPQRSQQAISEQRAQPALRLSARGNGRIPDERFQASFGRGHVFHMGNPVMVGGYSRFQYGGYWFGFVQPWPVGWYYTDDVYIDYVDGGYYMYDPYYPGARFAISVVL